MWGILALSLGDFKSVSWILLSEMAKSERVRTSLEPEMYSAFSEKANAEHGGEAQALRYLVNKFVNDEIASSNVTNEDLLEEIQNLKDRRVQPRTTTSSEVDETMLHEYNPDDIQVPEQLRPDVRDDANYDYTTTLSNEALQAFKESNKALNPFHVSDSQRPSGEENAVALSIAVLKYNYDTVSETTILDAITDNDDGVGYDRDYVKNKVKYHKKVGRQLLKDPGADKYAVTRKGEAQIINSVIDRFEEDLSTIRVAESKMQFESGVQNAKERIASIFDLVDQSRHDWTLDLEERLADAKADGRENLYKERKLKIETKLNAADQKIESLGEASTPNEINRIADGFNRLTDRVEVIAQKIDFDVSDDVADLEEEFEEMRVVSERRVQMELNEDADELVVELQTMLDTYSGWDLRHSGFKEKMGRLEELLEFDGVDVGVDIAELKAVFEDKSQYEFGREESRQTESQFEQSVEKAEELINQAVEGDRDVDELMQRFNEVVSLVRDMNEMDDRDWMADAFADLIVEFETAVDESYNPSPALLSLDERDKYLD